MRVRLLGSSAGGGLPQWNCRCPNCEAARAGTIPARTQSCIAISGDGEHWFLINASPDLRVQIEEFPPLQPKPGSPRNSPIEGVLATNADLDHVLGLFLLRDGAPLAIWASDAVRQTISTHLRLDAILENFCGILWQPASLEFRVLCHRDGTPSGLSYRAIYLPGGPPKYAEDFLTEHEGHSVAWQIRDDTTRACLLAAPDIEQITTPLLVALKESDIIIFDGTFWSDAELLTVKPLSRKAKAMGHLPVCFSLATLQNLAARNKIYTHINNTNPVLNPVSPERKQVEDAGVTIGVDGMELII